jgi:hypothetical protein
MFTVLQRFKKTIRMLLASPLGLVLLIILAGLGIGLAGGLPAPSLNRREEIEVTDESVEEDIGKTLRMEKE